MYDCMKSVFYIYSVLLQDIDILKAGSLYRGIDNETKNSISNLKINKKKN